MLEKLKASARDVALAFVAAFVGAFVMPGDVSYPALKAAIVAAGYAAIRAAVGVLAAKLAKD